MMFSVKNELNVLYNIFMFVLMKDEVVFELCVYLVNYRFDVIDVYLRRPCSLTCLS